MQTIHFFVQINCVLTYHFKRLDVFLLFFFHQIFLSCLSFLPLLLPFIHFLSFSHFCCLVTFKLIVFACWQSRYCTEKHRPHSRVRHLSKHRCRSTLSFSSRLCPSIRLPNQQIRRNNVRYGPSCLFRRPKRPILNHFRNIISIMRLLICFWFFFFYFVHFSLSLSLFFCIISDSFSQAKVICTNSPFERTMGISLWMFAKSTRKKHFTNLFRTIFTHTHNTQTLECICDDLVWHYDYDSAVQIMAKVKFNNQHTHTHGHRQTFQLARCSS